MKVDLAVYGDIHNHVKSVEKFLNKHQPERVIWLGDWFDSFDDSPKHAKMTALAYREIMIQRPQDIFLLSNHDFAYRFWKNNECRCSGFTVEKAIEIAKIMTPEFWARTKLWHLEDEILYTHAGINEASFNGYFNLDKLEWLSKMALTQAEQGQDPAFLTNPYSIIWQRHPHASFINFNQIYGHTPRQRPEVLRRGDIWNLDMDCAHNFFLFFSDNKMYLHDKKKNINTPFEEFKFL